MKRINTVLVFLVALSIISCEKENIELEGRQENNLIIAPLMLEALVEENTGSYEIELRSSQIDNRFENYYSVGTISQGVGGPVLYLGIAGFPSFPSRQETFPLTLKFGVDEMDPQVGPSQDELTSYFSEGREFSFGEGNGQVQFGILLVGGDEQDRRSRSDYMTVPEGSVIVERVEPFVAALTEIAGGDREYLMITFSFSGEVGIHSAREELTAERNGVPYVASRNANITGTATLVLAADPG